MHNQPASDEQMTLFSFRSTNGNKQALLFSVVEGRCRRANEPSIDRTRLSLNANLLPSVYFPSSLRPSSCPFTRLRSVIALLSLR